jgi:hypothetical protein
MENQSGRGQENLDLTQTEQEIDKVRTPGERSAEKWSLQPWKDKYEELLANFTGSRDNVRDHLERDLDLADADRIEPFQPLKIEQNMQKELKGAIVEGYGYPESKVSKIQLEIGALKDSLNNLLIDSKKYITNNKMSPLKPGILEFASEVEELFDEKAKTVKESEQFETSVIFERISAFFNSGLKFQELSKSESAMVKKVIENVYGRGSVVFDMAKRNVPIPNHQKAKFIEEVNNMKSL